MSAEERLDTLLWRMAGVGSRLLSRSPVEMRTRRQQRQLERNAFEIGREARR